MLLFILTGILQAWASNILNKLSYDLYPDENRYGYWPSRRILKRIENEHKADKDLMRRLKKGRTVGVSALLVFIILLVTFFFGNTWTH
jgi:hypothetical protein